ncbi:hypothetical protein PAPYR_1417 [Paratrimastix pyriformis]|uniref:RING-type domain-containing protein n=1 Tax=Paratrimastix pyriformis TaxID=342808 RepID=A0ABQ8UWU4_9EUKA|nr:hypothetical protein PAPYR_1417 [Paratrimastix pyriformis]
MTEEERPTAAIVDEFIDLQLGEEPLSAAVLALGESESSPFETVSMATLEDKMMKDVNMIAATTSCTFDEVFMVFHHLQWNFQATVEGLKTSKSRVLVAAGAQLAPTVAPLPPPEQQFVCSACGNTLPRSQGLALQCGHPVCKACLAARLQQHYRAPEDLALAPPEMLCCLQRGCTLRYPDTLTRRMLDGPHLAAYTSCLCMSYLAAAPSPGWPGPVRWCPHALANPRCRTAYAARGALPSDGRAVPCTCQRCGLVFCFRCGAEDHAPLPCAAVSAWQTRVDHLEPLAPARCPRPGCGASLVGPTRDAPGNVVARDLRMKAAPASKCRQIAPRPRQKSWFLFLLMVPLLFDQAYCLRRFQYHQRAGRAEDEALQYWRAVEAGEGDPEADWGHLATRLESLHALSQERRLIRWACAHLATMASTPGGLPEAVGSLEAAVEGLAAVLPEGTSTGGLLDLDTPGALDPDRWTRPSAYQRLQAAMQELPRSFALVCSRFKNASYAALRSRRVWTVSAMDFMKIQGSKKNNERYWQDAVEPDSMFGKVQKLHSICWVEVRHELALPPGHYKCTWRMRYDGVIPSREIPHFDVEVGKTLVLSRPFPVEIYNHRGYTDWDLGEFDVPVPPPVPSFSERLHNPQAGETTMVHVGMLEFSSTSWKEGIHLDFFRMTRLEPDPRGPCVAVPMAISIGEREKLRLG